MVLVVVAEVAASVTVVMMVRHLHLNYTELCPSTHHTSSAPSPPHASGVAATTTHLEVPQRAGQQVLREGAACQRPLLPSCPIDLRWQCCVWVMRARKIIYVSVFKVDDTGKRLCVGLWVMGVLIMCM